MVIAEESQEVKRFRCKVQKKIIAEKAKITADSLKKISESIHYWLERHHKERIPLKKGTIYKNAETSNSRFVVHLLEKLKAAKNAASPLKGRIQTSND